MTDEDSLCCMALKLGLPKRLLKESVEKRKEDICQRVFWLKTITLWYAYHLMTVVMLGYLILRKYMVSIIMTCRFFQMKLIEEELMIFVRATTGQGDELKYHLGDHELIQY